MELSTEQEIKDYLYGKALRLADQADCFFTAIEQMKSTMTIPEFEIIVDEMEKRVIHKRGWEKEIADWYAKMDRQERNTGD